MRCFLRVTRNSILATIFTFFYVQASIGMPVPSSPEIAHNQLIDGYRATLRDLLIQLKNKYKVNILFDDGLVNQPANRALLTGNATLEQSLTRILKPHKLYFKKFSEDVYVITREKETKNRSTTIEIDSLVRGEGFPGLPDNSKEARVIPQLESLNLGTPSSDRSVGGKVTDEKGEPLPGVNILLKGTTRGVTTDISGYFSIDVPNGDAVLVFSFVGYLSQEVVVGSRTSVEVSLKADEKSLEEVVVVGYGTQSRTTLTTAVSKIDNRVLENSTYGNVASALQGAVSGVRVQTTSGQPGAAPRVIVRGGTSINNPDGAQPLYVVDGVIRVDLNGINPLDIESMQVLKDAAATAIYGARGSNGVVIVSLKRGAVGKTSINYNYSLSFTNLRKRYDVLSARDYIYYGRLGVAATGEKHPERLLSLTAANGFGTGNDLTNNTAFTTQYLTEANKHKLDEGWQSMADPLDPSKTIIFSDTDWQDVLFRTGITHEHYLSFSGGTKKATFNLGTGYTSIDGIAINTRYSRFSTNLNSTLQIRDNLSAFAGLNFSRFGDNQAYSDVIVFGRSIGTPPSAKYKFEDGSLSPGQNLQLGNSEYYMSRIPTDNQQNLITLSGGLNWEILPHLTFEPTASLFYRVRESNSFAMAYWDGPTTLNTQRNASSSYNKWDQKQLEATLSYDRFWDNKHNLSAKLGVSYFHRDERSLSANGRGAATDLIPTLNAAATPTGVSSQLNSQAILGYFGRLTYDYKRKYLLAINGRYDGASNLGENNKWGFFPGISGGWNVHLEDFWNPSLPVSNFKIRASYGVNGNLGAISDYQAQGQYAVGARYNNIAAISYSVMANQNLKWEQSKTLDFGIDAGLLKDKIRLTFDWYKRRTDNLITTLALPEESGFSSILTNLGSLQNHGIEFAVEATIINRDDLFWDISFNASKNKNKILKLPQNENENNRIGGYYVFDQALGDYTWKGGLQEGQALGDLYAYKQLGIYATDEEAANGPVDELVSGADKTKFGGDVNWLDVDGNNIIDSRDRVYMGNIYPSWTGGIVSNIAYKGFSLYLRMDYTAGHSIYNYLRIWMNSNLQGDINASTDILRSWKQQGDQTDIPRYYWTDQSAQSNIWRNGSAVNGGGSSYYYQKGNFLALREITLKYDIPHSWIQRIKMNSLQFNITANNLKYFTKYEGLSPEEGGDGDLGKYPVPRVIMVGIKTSF